MERNRSFNETWLHIQNRRMKGGEMKTFAIVSGIFDPFDQACIGYELLALKNYRTQEEAEKEAKKHRRLEEVDYGKEEIILVFELKAYERRYHDIKEERIENNMCEILDEEENLT
jgi:hypothetical protein